jgi:hypothetical protein
LVRRPRERPSGASRTRWIARHRGGPLIASKNERSPRVARSHGCRSHPHDRRLPSDSPISGLRAQALSSCSALSTPGRAVDGRSALRPEPNGLAAANSSWHLLLASLRSARSTQFQRPVQRIRCIHRSAQPGTSTATTRT